MAEKSVFDGVAEAVANVGDAGGHLIDAEIDNVKGQYDLVAGAVDSAVAKGAGVLGQTATRDGYHLAAQGRRHDLDEDSEHFAKSLHRVGDDILGGDSVLDGMQNAGRSALDAAAHADAAAAHLGLGAAEFVAARMGAGDPVAAVLDHARGSADSIRQVVDDVVGDPNEHYGYQPDVEY
jgi:hypothetical protein